MSKKDIKIAELEADIQKLKKKLIEEQIRCSKLIEENGCFQESIEELKKYFKERMSEAKLKNDALISAIKSTDTELFIYNGDTYQIKQLRFNQCAECVDTIDLELVKVNTVITYNDGLIGKMQKAIESVSNSLKVSLFGDEKNKED